LICFASFGATSRDNCAILTGKPAKR
jgi:hypothetical protein